MKLQRVFRFHGRKFDDSKWFSTKLFYSLPKDFEFQASHLLKQGFSSGVDEDKYCSLPYAHVLALERGSVIGVARLFSRCIVFDGELVFVGGFGSVTTRKNRRRLGVASALLQRGMEDFRLRLFDLAFLNSDVHNLTFVRLYGRVGFVALDKPYSCIGKSGRKYVSYDGMIAPVTSLGIYKRVLSSKSVLDIAFGSW